METQLAERLVDYYDKMNTLDSIGMVLAVLTFASLMFLLLGRKKGK